MNQKLPITNRVVTFDCKFNLVSSKDIPTEGEVICAAQSEDIIYYLHATKILTIFESKTEKITAFPLETKSFPHLVEPYKGGVAYPFSANKIAVVKHNPQNSETTSTIE